MNELEHRQQSLELFELLGQRVTLLEQSNRRHFAALVALVGGWVLVAVLA